MKATRRILSLALALIMAALVFCMPVSATGTAPLIMVNGIGSTPLYKNFGTDKEELVFSADEEFIEGLITDVGSALISGIISYNINGKSYDAFADSFFPSLKPLLSSIGYGLDGKSLDDTIGFYQNEKPMSDYTDEEMAVLSEFTYAYAEQYGPDFVYNFSYDWRDISLHLDRYCSLLISPDWVIRGNSYHPCSIPSTAPIASWHLGIFSSRGFPILCCEVFGHPQTFGSIRPVGHIGPGVCDCDW